MDIQKVESLSVRNWTTHLIGLVGLMLCLSGCSKTTDPPGFGAVTGAVRLPFTAAASGAPAMGAQVRITAGGFDSTIAADSSGIFLMDHVPAGTASVTATLTSCFSGSRTGVRVVKNDTVTADVTMASQLDADTIALPVIVSTSAPRQMELVPGGNQAILLYDTSAVSPLPPSLLSVNLATGVAQLTQFTDLRQAYDLKVVGPNLAVFSFLSIAGFGLRFVDLTTMTKSGRDVLYDSVPIGLPGHIAMDNTSEHVFVAHARWQGTSFVGKVYAVSVTQRELVDADNNPGDGSAAFDTLLIRRSVGRAYNIAYDNSTDEILVANNDAGFITAISWNKWGTFDRAAHATMPVPGVRSIRVNAQIEQFQPWFLGIGDGSGVALWPQNAWAVRFSSGSGAADLAYTDPTVAMSSEVHYLTVVPSRQSWFTLFSDFTEPDVDKQQRAVEERSLNTLHRLYRFQSHHFVLPDRGFPRTFAVDAANKRLYVAYSNRPILEVFCLP